MSNLKKPKQQKIAAKILLCAATSLVVTTAQAAGAVTSTIAEILKYTTSTATYIRMQTTPTGFPACHVHPSHHFAFNVVGEETKQMYAALLAAQVSGKTVQVYGKDVRNVQGNIET